MADLTLPPPGRCPLGAPVLSRQRNSLDSNRRCRDYRAHPALYARHTGSFASPENVGVFTKAANTASTGGKNTNLVSLAPCIAKAEALHEVAGEEAGVPHVDCTSMIKSGKAGSILGCCDHAEGDSKRNCRGCSTAGHSIPRWRVARSNSDHRGSLVSNTSNSDSEWWDANSASTVLFEKRLPFRCIPGDGIHIPCVLLLHNWDGQGLWWDHRLIGNRPDQFIRRPCFGQGHEQRLMTHHYVHKLGHLGGELCDTRPLCLACPDEENENVLFVEVTQNGTLRSSGGTPYEGRDLAAAWVG
ncbi:UNVERIFIED_CONTAM: hypothetical protein FKN15_021771 [Acipenser sinensis]